MDKGRYTAWEVWQVSGKRWAWRIARAEYVEQGEETTEGKAYTAADLALDNLLERERLGA